MATAQSEWLRIFSGATNYARWQSFYIGQTVNNYTHLPFSVGGITVSASGDQSTLSVKLPATLEVVNQVDAAIRNAYLCEVQSYEFDPDTTYSSPPTGQTLVASFVGEVIGGTDDRTIITLQLGSSLSAVGAQFPPRKYTTILVGEPYRS